MQIPNFAEPAEIRRAYLRMAKQYHPDVNLDQEAEEIFKLVNKAHETLSNPAKKKIYDQRLKYGYVLEGIQLVHNSKEERFRRAQERKKARAKKSREKEIEKYEASLKRFPLFARFGIYSLILLYGMFLWFEHWVVNYANLSIYSLILGILLSMIGTVTLIDTNYKRMRIREFRRGVINKHEKKSVWTFITMLIVIPVIVLQLNQYRTRYHLSHYSDYALAVIKPEDLAHHKIEYTYVINDKKYRKSTSDVNKVYGMDNKYWLVLRYSKRKPILSEPVDYAEYGRELFKNKGHMNLNR